MELLNNLNISLTAILVNIAGFLVLLWVMNKVIFGPIGAHLAGRQQDINQTYDQLEADRRQMETLRTDYEQRLAQIEAESREKIQSAIKDAQAARDGIVAEANTRSREMIRRAEEEIGREREQAMITLRQQVVDLALGAATKVIGDGLDATRQRRLIDDFIASGVAAQSPQSAPAAPPSSNGAGSPPAAGPAR